MTAASDVASDLRILADLVDANPVLGELLSTSLQELRVFPHTHGVDAQEIDDALATQAFLISEGVKFVQAFGLLAVRAAVLPAGRVHIRVYHQAQTVSVEAKR